MDLIQKTRDDYNKIAKHFSGTRHSLWPELVQFKPFLHDGQQILDWGCGNGQLLGLFKDFAIHYTGIDQSAELLKIARKTHAAEIKNGKARFYCNANKNKTFPANYFDIVFMVASFHHLPDRRSRLSVLKQIYEEMKPGGRLIMTVWNLASDWAKEKLKKDYKKIGEQDFLIPWKDPTGRVVVERYYHYFLPEEIGELLTTTGFVNEPNEAYNRQEFKSEKGGRNLVVVTTKK